MNRSAEASALRYSYQSVSLKILERIDSRAVLVHFKMKVGTSCIAAAAYRADQLTTLDLIANPHHDLTTVGV